MRNGFIFDLNKCVGCEACVIACQMENHELQAASWRSVSTFNAFRHPALPLFHFSLACNHCDEPSCLTGCPANAFSIDPVYHTVDHDQDRCIGCRYCTWTCPYDAPKYVTAKGTIEKCTLCKEKLVHGRKPNCANLCPTGALDYGEIVSEASAGVAGFPDKGIGPGIEIVPLRKKERPVSAKRSLDEIESTLFHRAQVNKPRKSTLKSEWPLVIFTLLAAFSFAVIAASMVSALPLEPLVFLISAVAGLIVSAAHLGRPLISWRALLNIRSSWLSREIVAYSLFLGSSAVFLLVSPSLLLGVVSLILGFAALVSIDMVYATVEQRSNPFTGSGSIALTGVLFFAVLAEIPMLVAALLAWKCLFYVKALLSERRRSLRRVLAATVRITAGFVIPLILLTIQGSMWSLGLFVLVGESINRAEFYLDLDIVTPRRQIEQAMLRELALSETQGG